MGLGPSTKMTTKHHFYCPATQVLSADSEIEFAGVLVDGVSELYDDKVFTAKVTAQLAEELKLDGALVAIDGWGNHHVDFVNVIAELRKRGIQAVGLSYIGTQGKLVCEDPLVDCIVDFNKCESGFESCITGENNLGKEDAYKALGLLKYRMKKGKRQAYFADASLKKIAENIMIQDRYMEKKKNVLTRKYCDIKSIEQGDQTVLEKNRLILNRELCSFIQYDHKWIKEIHLSVCPPGKRDFFVNTNLDFMPVAAKQEETLGEGVTLLLNGVTLMLTGKEESGFQPSNIGSSEGILAKQVVFGREGTPQETDTLIHLDVIFKEGMGRRAEAVIEAHRAADEILDQIRKEMRKHKDDLFQIEKNYPGITEYTGKKRVGLVKIVSGLGNMYDTFLFPNSPGGIIGGICMREEKNMPHLLTPNQCLDGAIHSLL